jgi:ATP-dependent helicase/nuclease subunit A
MVPSMKTRKPAGKMERHWLGWERPLLHATVDFLLEKYAVLSDWDMDQVICVFPSSMASRRLAELLAERAQRKSLVLRPPTIMTIGQLPEQLYQARFPFASEYEQLLGWTKILRAAPADFLKPLLIEIPPAAQVAPWVELAGLLASLHRELSSDLTLFADVAQRLKGESELADEAVRWQVLAKLQRDYLDELHRAGRWDIQTARRYAIDKQEPRTDRDIVVVGAVDLNRAQRQFLQAVEERVTVLIGAPKSWRDGFDEFGTLKGYFWEHLPVELRDEQLVPRATANESADEVARQLAYLGSKYTAQEITIGVPDPNLIPLIQERLERVGIRGRSGAGTMASQTSPIRLLKAIVEYLNENNYESLAALVRFPAVYDLLVGRDGLPENFLESVDRYYQQTLIGQLGLGEFPQAAGVEVFQRLFERVNEWLRPLRQPAMELKSWAKPFQEVLAACYQTTIADLDSEQGDKLADACRQLGQAITQLGDLPTNLMLVVSHQEALKWLVHHLEKVTVPPLRDPESIEMIGWLDLSLDDAPVLLLTGIHDGTVPESVNADAFLPNRIRSELGLMDNTRRYARDSYSLHVLMNSREHLRVITNHLSLEGEPHTPSRLLLAVPPERLASRVLELIHPPASIALPEVQGTVQPRSLQSWIPIPLPEPRAGDRVTSMSASDFQAYLQCPYRFYLKKIQRLKSVDDRKTELEANDFGNLLHDTLARLPHIAAGTATDASQLRQALFHELQGLVTARYGRQLAPVVAVQVEQARQRLAAFAKLQAARNQEGWQIWATEVDVGRDRAVLLPIPGQEPMPLVGRIDRIDYHPATGRYALWDYKTSDQPVKPVAAHWSKAKGWSQVQLPLYLWMAPSLGLTGEITTGYIALPRAVDKVAFTIADFSKVSGPSAIEVAVQVVQRIRRHEFWPPSYTDLPPWDEFAAICQSEVVRRWDERLEAGITAPTVTALSDMVSEQGKGEDPLDSSGRPSPVRPPQRPTAPPAAIAIPLDSTTGSPRPEWFDRTLIEASAGTGKTYQLAIRMIRLLFARQSAEGILATTFTRKAAGEILARVLSFLADAIHHQDKLRQLQQELEPLKINRQSCLHHLANLCSNLHRLRVNTLDGFYSQLARSFALELQLPPGWTLADEFQEERLCHAAITRMFELEDRQLLRSLISQLNRGEAKRGIRQDILQTIEAGYQLYRITAPEAWSNLEVPTAPSEVELQQGLAEVEASQMPHANYAKARDALLAAVLQEDWTSFFAHGLVKSYQTSKTYYKKPLPDGFCRGLEVLLTYALSRELGSRRAQTEAAYALLKNYDQHLEAVKRTQRVLTFSDVSYRLARWFRQASTGQPRPESADRQLHQHLPKANYRLDAQIDHLLVDEFQDTSPTQWDILAPFAEAVVKASSEGKPASFFCVGDVKQAIYGWRGGVAELFEVVRRKFIGLREDSLTASWRSSPVIIEFVNRIFKNLLQHPKLGNGEEAARIWTEVFPTHSTKKTSLPGYVALRNVAVEDEPAFVSNEADEEDGDVGSDSPLLDRCIADVADLNRRAPDVSIGVLVRTNQEVGQVIHRLREVQVEASQEGGNPLVDSAAVELMLSCVHLADHPGDSVARFHLQHSPFQGLFEIDAENGDARSSIDRLALKLRRDFDELGYGRAIAALVRRLAPACSSRDQMRLDQLVQLAYRYDAVATLRNRDFVDYVRSHKVALSRPAPVRVMTIHQAKGLEFDAVFLPGLNRRLIDRPPIFITSQSNPVEPPKAVMRFVNEQLRAFLGQAWQQAYAQQAIQAYTEAFSLFYVALTRARQALYLYAMPAERPSQRWDSLLHSLLVDPAERGKSESVVFEVGEAAWYGTPGAIATVVEQTEPPRPARLQVRLLPPQSHSFLRQHEGLKPSAAVENRRVAIGQLIQPEESIAALIGTLVHRWFEEIVWLDDFHWDRTAMHALALNTLTPEQMPLIRLQDCLDEMESYLRLTGVRHALSRERYQVWRRQYGEGLTLEVTNERRLLRLLDGKLLRGTVDRLIIGSLGGRIVQAEILDYKTDSLDPNVSLDAWTEERLAHHGPQLKIYRRVLCEQFQLPEEKIGISLLLLRANRCLPIIDR